MFLTRFVRQTLMKMLENALNYDFETCLLVLAFHMVCCVLSGWLIEAFFLLYSTHNL